MDQRDSHCPYSLSSETTAKPTVLGVLVCQLRFWFFSCFFLKRLEDELILLCHNYTFYGLSCGLSDFCEVCLWANGSFPFELVCCRLFFFLFVQQRGKKTLLSLTLICHCHLVGMAKIVRGSTFGYDHETPLLDDLADLL